MRMTLANLPSRKIPRPRMWEINFSAGGRTEGQGEEK